MSDGTEGTGTYTYQWYASASTDTTAKWTAIDGAIANTFVVTTSEVGKFIKVVVTNEAGAEGEDVTTSPVSVDASSDVSIVDVMGLQSDGTGIVGDTLRLSYGADFGTVTTVSWYRNGSVLVTSGSGNDGIAEGDGGLTLRVNAGRGTGTYKATVVADGVRYETNEIEITDKEEAAEILEFTLENDYTDGLDIHYATTDKRAVATVTMNKNYDGKFSVYRATDTSFKSALATDSLTTSTAVATQTAADAIKAAAAVADQSSVLTTNAATDYQVLTAANIGSGYGYINPDGTVTYKWVLNNTGVTRGADYVVAFDQDSISSDKPGSGIANASDKATAPYIVAPAAIEVTKVAAGVKPEITIEDENGEVLGWFGYEEGAVATREPNGIAVSTKTTLANVGAASAQIYAATNKTTDPNGTGVSVIATGVTNRNTDAVDKGVWASTVPAGDQAYFFATVKFNKGLFGADALELKSEAVATAQPAATDMSILEDKTTATSAVVSFANLRADGTVYVARGRFLGDGTNTAPAATTIETVAKIVEAFNPDDTTTYVAKADVEAGAKSVTIDNAIGSYTGASAAAIPLATAYVVDGAVNTENGGITTYASGTTYGTDDYVAIFVPNDTENYGQISTSAQMSKDPYTLDSDTNTWNSLRVSAVPTSIAYDKTVAGSIDQAALVYTITGTKLLAKDQFGNTVRNAITDAQKVKSTTVTDGALTANRERGEATYTVANTGVVTITLTTTTTTDKGDSYAISILGSTVTAKAEYTNCATGAVANANNKAWKVTVGSDTLADVATAKKTEYTAITGVEFTFTGFDSTNLVATATPAVGTAGELAATRDGTAVTAAPTVADPNVTFVLNTPQNGNTVQIITITGATYTRTITVTTTDDGTNWTAAGITTDTTL